MTMASKGSRREPSKLCRRTFFLQTGTAPSLAEMRSELGPELADIIVATLEPGQRTAVQPNRMVVESDGSEGAHDADKVRGHIHEHILRLGGDLSQRLEGYWRERLHRAATTVGPSADDVDFLRFECRQKIGIAREEERRRYDAILERRENTMRERFWQEKGDLHRSYAEARALWGKFVCRKVRKQAKDMLCKVAAHYRSQLEREVTARLREEKARLVKEMEQIVKIAVDQQKRMDERAVRWQAYQYEELLRFINECDGCSRAVEVTREVCKLHNPTERTCRSTQVSNCSIASNDHVEQSVAESLSNASHPSTATSEDRIELPPLDLSQFYVFVVSQCLPEPEGEPGGSIEGSNEAPMTNGGAQLSSKPSEESGKPFASEEQDPDTSDEDSTDSSDWGSIEKIMIGGLTYAQPKYYNKTYRELFGDVTLRWERIGPVESAVATDNDQVEVEGDDRSGSGVSSIAVESHHCWRESYDATAEIGELLLPARKSEPQMEVTEEGPFGQLFDVSMSAEAIAEVAEGFAFQYIRATSDDFAAMFPRDG